MQTFADWLSHYNDLDVAPGSEALEKMPGFYTEKGIDIFKDVVSIPEVNLHYLFRGAVERGVELWSPCSEAYEILKGAVVGGPSIVFTCYHKAVVTNIRSHQVADPQPCKSKNIIGYDANALYLSPCYIICPADRKNRALHPPSGCGGDVSQRKARRRYLVWVCRSGHQHPPPIEGHV